MNELLVQAGWISAEEGSGWWELVASGSRSAVPVDPSGVGASDETGSAALHCTDCGACAGRSAGAAWRIASRSEGAGCSSSDEGNQTEEEGLHFNGLVCLRLNSKVFLKIVFEDLSCCLMVCWREIQARFIPISGLMRSRGIPRIDWKFDHDALQK